jgi:hypothetical protein
MARVPVLQQRVAPTALPTPQLQVAPSGVGAIEAEAIGQIGKQVERFGEVALQEERRAEAISIKAAAEKAKAAAEFQEEQDKFWADNRVLTFQDQLRNLKLEQSTSAPINPKTAVDNFDSGIDKLFKDALKGADNPRKEELLTAKIAKLRETALNSEQTRAINVWNTAKDRQNDAIIENTVRDAREAHNDPLSLFSLRLTLDDAIMRKTSGMDTDTASNVKDEVVSAFHEGIINEKVVASAEIAQQYYNDNKTEIVPENREAIEETINKEGVLQFAQQKTDEIVLRESDRTKWADMARKETTDPEKRKALVDSVKTRKKELDQLDKEGAVKADDEITDAIIDAPDLTSAYAQADKAKGKSRMQHRAHADARFKEKTSKVTTDPVVEEEANRMVTTGEIRTSQQYIRATAGNMSDSDLQKNLKFLAQGGEVGNIQEGKLRSKFTEIMGVAPKVDPFLYKISRDYIVDQIQATGKPPTDTNIDEWMGQALLSGFETETLDKVFTFEREITAVEALRKGVAFTTEITDEEKADIISDMEAFNATQPLGSRLLINADSVERVFLRDEGFNEEQINKIMGL